jgi:hypothetical protein
VKVKPPTIDASTPVQLPTDKVELARCMGDVNWRISHLYKILVKGDDPDPNNPDHEPTADTILNFRPNRAQRRLISRLWFRNLVLKARQMGFTTLACILWLDHALFNSNQRCGIVAHDRPAAANILRDKVKFAYDQLPETLKRRMPIAVSNASEVVFAHNNSSVRVATSMRSGTIHRLHVSEYGKICAKYPAKAVEVMTGSLPAVPSNGIVIIESTAEGQDGDFYKKSELARAQAEKRKKLTPKDFRFHFYAWWQEPKYRMAPEGVLFTQAYTQYFQEVEALTGTELDREQKAWYIATKESEMSGNDEMMWREYPSYPGEAFKVSTAGAYYALQLAQARKAGRIGVVPFLPGYPVHTFWDLGLNDLQALWFMQAIGLQHRFIRYYENSGEGVAHYVRYMQQLSTDHGYIYGTHHLPHDGAHRRVAMEQPQTYEQLLRKLEVKNIKIVPRVTHLTTGIQQMRDMFPQCWFDETDCAAGLARLQNYKKQWNTSLGTWMDHPREDDNKNGADAIRQYAQGFRGTPAHRARQTPSNWRTA